MCIAEAGASDIIGSSTAFCLSIDGFNLYSAKLGVSGFLIIRDSQILYKSPGLLIYIRAFLLLTGPFRTTARIQLSLPNWLVWGRIGCCSIGKYNAQRGGYHYCGH